MLPDRRSRSVHRAGLLIVTTLVGAVVVGCSRNPARPGEIDEPPETVEPASIDAVPAEPETAESATPPPAPSDPAPETPPEELAIPAPADPVPSEPTPEDPLGGAQEIRVELDDEQRATLVSNAERDLREARLAIREAEARSLSSEDHEKLATIEGLLAAAHDAFADDDIPAAATLANKARLLADELASN